MIMAFELFMELGYQWATVVVRPAFEPSNQGGETTQPFYQTLLDLLSVH